MDNPKKIGDLLQILRARDIPFEDEDIAAAFEGPERAQNTSQWIDQELGSDTLLSKHELDLYEELEKSGIARELSARHDLSIIRPIGDDEIRSSIAALQQSTAAIERQNEALTRQREALETIIANSKSEEVARQRRIERRRKRYCSEEQNIRLAEEELLHDFNAQLASSQKQLKSAQAALGPAVAELLRGDDKILARLQNMTFEFAIPNKETPALMEKVQQLCSKLVELNTQGIRFRLDRIFLELHGGIVKTPSVPSESQEAMADLQALQEELESLYSEIDSVAEMAVSQEYLEPILQHLEGQDHTANQLSKSCLDYVVLALTHLINKLQLVATRVNNHKNHRDALETLCTIASKELHMESPQNATPPPKSRNAVRRRTSASSNKSPGRNLKARRRSSLISFDDESEPHQQLLRVLGLSIPSDSDPGEMEEVLSLVLAERTAKLQSHITGIDRSMEAQIDTQLRAADGALQILLGSLFADSHSGTINLVDEEIRREVDRLAAATKSLEKDMAGLEMEALSRNNPERDRLAYDAKANKRYHKQKGISFVPQQASPAHPAEQSRAPRDDQLPTTNPANAVFPDTVQDRQQPGASNPLPKAHRALLFLSNQHLPRPPKNPHLAIRIPKDDPVRLFPRPTNRKQIKYARKRDVHDIQLYHALISSSLSSGAKGAGKNSPPLLARPTINTPQTDFSTKAVYKPALLRHPSASPPPSLIYSVPAYKRVCGGRRNADSSAGRRCVDGTTSGESEEEEAVAELSGTGAGPGPGDGDDLGAASTLTTTTAAAARSAKKKADEQKMKRTASIVVIPVPPLLFSPEFARGINSPLYMSRPGRNVMPLCCFPRQDPRPFGWNSLLGGA
ncbi:MAG: hypothetical protein M1829_001333 [Trizodia sp. TS-e1964]|nr:MAG: hypothetical protein M1829_001333 [Trizodia sp. TS-e1964]